MADIADMLAELGAPSAPVTFDFAEIDEEIKQMDEKKALDLDEQVKANVRKGMCADCVMCCIAGGDYRLMSLPVCEFCCVHWHNSSSGEQPIGSIAQSISGQFAAAASGGAALSVRIC